MATTLALDVYGTLIDTHAITEELEGLLGERALAFARAWRERQLEYAFRRTIMGWYADFSVCIRDALDYTASAFGITLAQADRERLLAAYQRLPAFQEAQMALQAVQEQGHVAYAFTNGSREAASKLLGDNSLRPYVRDIVSAEQVEAFKPSPRVYDAFLAATGSRPEQTWLVSSNAFDIVGARACGWHAVWVRRLPGAIFDSWGEEPTATIASLADLPSVLPPR